MQGGGEGEEGGREERRHLRAYLGPGAVEA